MFFQQSHNARSAVQEAEENELEAYYFDTVPWTISSRKRSSGATSVHSHHSDHLPIPSRSPSLVEFPTLPIPSRQTSIASRYNRQLSVPRSAAFTGGRKPTGNPAWRHFKRLLSTSFGLFLIIQTYLCIGAFCFMWLEAAKETIKKKEMEDERWDIIDQLNNSDASGYEDILKNWEKMLLKYPQIYSEIEGDAKVWSWIFSYYCSFTIISTIGYGNVTPLSVLGRLFAIVYAIVGIPLMLLFITDIGSKFARWTKIAIIKFRKWKYGIRSRLKLRRDANRKENGEGEDGTSGKTCKTGREDGGNRGGAKNEYTGIRAHSVPEVHINIAMSTVDEEVCPMEEKVIGSSILGEGTPGYLRDNKEDYLHPRKDNSDYGGSSTGVEACIAETSSLNAQEPEHDVFLDICRREEVVSHVVKVNMEVDKTIEDPGPQTHEDPGPQTHEDPGPQTHEDPGPQTHEEVDKTIEDPGPQTHEEGETRDGSPASSRVQVTSSAVNDRRSSENESLSSLDEDKATDNIQTETEIPTPDRVSDYKAALNQHEPSEVLHTQLRAQKTPSLERICDRCGQSMQNIQITSTEVVRDVDSKTLKLDDGSKGQKQSSPEAGQLGASRDKHSVPPVEDYKIHTSSRLSCLQKSFILDLKRKQLSRKTSRSLDDISSTSSKDAINREVSESHRRGPRGPRKRITSAPVVRFRTDITKQNGRLLTQHIEERRRVDDRTQVGTDKDESDDPGDKMATDSGVASSTSNSTECSPKRRPGLLSIITDCNLETEATHQENSEDEDDIFGNDDVMDSEEEKVFEKLGRRRLATTRLPETDQKSNFRVSEVDIAMLSIPIWLAFLLLLVYLFIGAGCFAWFNNSWSFLDGFYFCFISLSTIGFGDLVIPAGNLYVDLIFSFVYSFIGLCFTSMCMSLSSMELTILSRKIAGKFGTYRGRLRSLRAKRWASRRRRAIRAPSPER